MLKKLYKYRECNDLNISNFENGKCWFSPVKFMNDPFEAHLCSTHIKLLKSAALINAERHGIPFDLALHEVFHAESNGEMNVAALLEELKEDVRNTFAAFCLSSRWDSPVMWAHYTSNYKGFCIGYEFDDAWNWHRPHAFQFPQDVFMGKVRYVDAALDHLDDNGNIIMENLVNVLAAKHKDWEYEQEYRFAIKSDPGKGEIRKIPDEALKEVIVGDKMDASCLEKILNIARAKGIPVFRVNYSTVEFKLDRIVV